jgi:putative hydrolase of the HAD superfamily
LSPASGACRAVLFDLFDTLVRFERERLPEVQINGRTLRSTAGRLHAALQPLLPAVRLADFVGALMGSWQEAEAVRSATHREVPAAERFGMLFRRLGLEAGALPPAVVPTLLRTHMEELSRAVVFPPHHRDLLLGLRRGLRLAVVSNFDYAPTARLVLEREGVAGLFDAIVVSDEVGWRKPRPEIFHTALDRLGVGPGEALFVGDRADIDVLGAQGVGMQAVWLNPAGEPLPAGAPEPEFQVRDLAEVASLVRRA